MSGPTRAAFMLTFIAMLFLTGATVRDLAFLLPYRSEIFGQYGAWIASYLAILAFNLFVWSQELLSMIALKGPGQKLRHLDRELHAGAQADDDIASPFDNEA